MTSEYTAFRLHKDTCRRKYSIDNQNGSHCALFRHVSTCSDVFRHVLIQIDQVPLQSTGHAISFDIKIKKIEPEMAELQSHKVISHIFQNDQKLEFPDMFKPVWRRIEHMNLTQTEHRWKAENLRIPKHSLLLKFGQF